MNRPITAFSRQVRIRISRRSLSSSAAPLLSSARRAASHRQESHVDSSTASGLKSDMRSPSHSPRTDFVVARCPKRTHTHPRAFACHTCGMEFAFESALQSHISAHETHLYECNSCLTRCTTRANLRSHVAAMHSPRFHHVCCSCGDEFLSEASLDAHVKREGTDHVSKKEHIEFHSAEDLNDSFYFPLPVNGQALSHTTNRRSAKAILSSSSFRGTAARGAHDGRLRRDTAPSSTFFNVEPSFQHAVTPLPATAQPGELLSSLAISLEAFTRKRDEFRLYFVAAVPLNAHLFSQATVRVTAMLARRGHWAWCDKQRMLPLDFRDNSLLRFDMRTETWHVASSVFTRDHGFRPVRLVVAVAGDEFEFAPRDCNVADLSHLSRPPQCPTCMEVFPHEMDLYNHLEASMPELSCPVDSCQVRVFRRRDLLEHMRDQHFDLEPYVCVHRNCGETFKTVHQLNQHKLTHADFLPTILCEVESCHKSFKTQHELRRHELQVHSDERPYACPSLRCHKVFKTLVEASVHEHRAHLVH